jgi:ATPase subunit of ABC transporter with duplicated ATPase domains
LAVAHLLGGEGLGLKYPTQVVFEAVTVGVNDGDRIGIVGRNGDGKSSLLGMLTGRVTPDSGRVTRRGGLRVAALEQADRMAPRRRAARIGRIGGKRRGTSRRAGIAP